MTENTDEAAAIAAAAAAAKEAMAEMREHELRAIAQQASKAAVVETLSALGLNMGDPLQVQADFRYLHKSRKGSEEVANWVKKACVTAFITGGLFMLWEGFKLISKAH